MKKGKSRVFDKGLTKSMPCIKLSEKREVEGVRQGSDVCPVLNSVRKGKWRVFDKVLTKSIHCIVSYIFSIDLGVCLFI